MRIWESVYIERKHISRGINATTWIWQRISDGMWTGMDPGHNKNFGPGLGYMFEKIWMVWLRFALKLSISNLTNFSSAINGYTKTRFDLNFSAAGAYRCESGVGDFDKILEILTCVQICILGFLLSKIFDGPQWILRWPVLLYF